MIARITTIKHYETEHAKYRFNLTIDDKGNTYFTVNNGKDVYSFCDLDLVKEIKGFLNQVDLNA